MKVTMTEEGIQVTLKIWWRTMSDNFFPVSGKGAILHLVPLPVLIVASFRILAKDTPHLRRYGDRVSKEDVTDIHQTEQLGRKPATKEKLYRQLKRYFY